jgi:hypothetical protein
MISNVRTELSLLYFCKQSSLNSVTNDVAVASKDAISFVGVVQNMYLFWGSASTWYWIILKKLVNKITVEPMSDTGRKAECILLGHLRFTPVKI